jgi:hypothetical protein
MRNETARRLSKREAHGALLTLALFLTVTILIVGVAAWMVARNGNP